MSKLYDKDGNEVKNVKVKKPFYKRWWFIALVAIIIIGALGNMGEEDTASDTGGEVAETENVAEATEETPEEDTAHTTGESFNNGSFEFVVDYSVESEISDGFSTYSPDGVYIVVNLAYENIASESQSLDNSSFKLVIDGNTYSSSTLITESLTMESINPGNKSEGNIHFDVPETVTESDNITLVFDGGIFSDGEDFEVKLK